MRCGVTEPHLSAHELQQGRVDGQLLDVGVDGRLVEGAGFAVQLVQAHLADGVAAAEADGSSHRLLERLRADGTQQEFGPLRRLDGHRHRTVYMHEPRPGCDRVPFIKQKQQQAEDSTGIRRSLEVIRSARPGGSSQHSAGPETCTHKPHEQMQTLTIFFFFTSCFFSSWF